jgi:Gas vesicle synthesis protein GvpL/GvpF
VSPASAKYVYGVIGAADDPSSAAGIGGVPVQLIRDGELAALVSDIDRDELQMGREAMTAHARVLEDALAQGTVLPMRFGVIMDDEDMVRRNLLQEHGSELQAQLRELAGKVELRLRASYEEDRLMREAVAHDPEILRVRDSLQGVPEDATYYARIELGERVAAAVERVRQADAETILGELAPLALAVESGDPGHERIALNASFLVERDRMAEFDERVDQIGGAQAGRLRFKYTGPLPPHSFVRLATAGV